MPPQGESTGLSLEDAILLSRILALHASPSTTTTSPPSQPPSITHLFKTYTTRRRPRINAAYDEAVFRWDTAKDSGWIAFKLKIWLTPWFIWWTGQRRARGFEEDLGRVDLGIEE